MREVCGHVAVGSQVHLEVELRNRAGRDDEFGGSHVQHQILADAVGGQAIVGIHGIGRVQHPIHVHDQPEHQFTDRRVCPVRRTRPVIGLEDVLLARDGELVERACHLALEARQVVQHRGRSHQPLHVAVAVRVGDDGSDGGAAARVEAAVDAVCHGASDGRRDAAAGSGAQDAVVEDVPRARCRDRASRSTVDGRARERKRGRRWNRQDAHPPVDPAGAAVEDAHRLAGQQSVRRAAGERGDAAAHRHRRGGDLGAAVTADHAARQRAKVAREQRRGHRLAALAGRQGARNRVVDLVGGLQP